MERAGRGAAVRGRKRPRRRMRAADRELAIRTAALRIFREKGYDAASMQDIADAVGLYKGSLYHYVSSKEELLIQLFEGRAGQVLREIDAVASGPGTPSERLRGSVRAYVLGVLEHLDSVHIYLREERALPPWALQQVHLEQRAMRDLFGRVIADGIRAGEFVESDPKLAALAVLGMCTWIHRWYRSNGRLAESVIADDFAERAARMLSV
jgi:AcrR family transcriptional regulator